MMAALQVAKISFGTCRQARHSNGTTKQTAAVYLLSAAQPQLRAVAVMASLVGPAADQV